MTPAETEPMSRPLLALCLYAFAAMALAGTPVASDDASGKPAKPAAAPAAATGESDSTPAATPAPAPSRAGSSRPSAKRWHSMLPGMIR
jgi:hypothetical protein